MSEVHYNLDGSQSATYKVVANFCITRQYQTLTLPYALYQSTIEIVKDGTTPVETIALGASTIEASRDDAAMSLAKCVKTDFDYINLTLVKVLTVKSAVTDPYWITITGYSMETPYENLENLGEGPIPTPGLMKVLLDEINYLTKSGGNPQDAIATLLSGNSPKEYDPTGKSEVNRVINEPHYVNVHNGKTTVIPSAGSFYSHDLVVTLESTNAVLQKDIDYKLAHADLQAIARSASPSPIYSRIVIKAPIVGNVLVTYRAVGGETTTAHFSQLAASVNTLASYMYNGGFVTTNSLSNVASFMALAQRVTDIEMELNLYPRYTYNITLDATPNEYHWYTVGNFNVFSEGIHKSGQINLEISTPNEGHNRFDIAVTYDLGVNSGLVVKTINSLGSPMGTVGKRMDLDKLGYYPPKLRIVTDGLTFAKLQLGYRTASAGSTLVQPTITNRSHIDTRFVLSSSALEEAPEVGDTTYEALVSHVEGEPLWYGTVSLNDLMEYAELDSMWDSSIYSLKDVSQVEFLIRDRFKNNFIIVKSDHYRNEEFVAGEVMFHPSDLCTLRYTLVKDTEIPTKVHFNIESELGYESENSARFELHRVVIKF